MKRSYVAMISDCPDFYGEIASDDKLRDIRWLAEQAVRNNGLKTSRSNPQHIKVAVYALEIKSGELKRRSCGEYNIMPQLEAMTKDEFDKEQVELLDQLPKEFQAYASIQAWERGHSSGYEEVINILQELVASLKDPIARYTRRLTSDTH